MLRVGGAVGGAVGGYLGAPVPLKLPMTMMMSEVSVCPDSGAGISIVASNITYKEGIIIFLENIQTDAGLCPVFLLWPTQM